MSDTAVAVIVAGVLQLAGMIIGFLKVQSQLKNAESDAKVAAHKAEEAADSAAVVMQKIDTNTTITTEAKDAASRAAVHSEECDEERAKLLRGLADHDSRIIALEVQMAAIKVSVDAVAKSVDSTRHEMRGHLQTITNSLHMMSMRGPSQVPVGPTPAEDQR